MEEVQKCRVVCANCHRKKGYHEQRLKEMTGEDLNTAPRPKLSKSQRQKNRRRHRIEQDAAYKDAIKNKDHLSGPNRKDSP